MAPSLSILLAVTFLSWQYFFIAPVAFSGLIAVCLLAAVWLAADREAGVRGRGYRFVGLPP